MGTHISATPGAEGQIPLGKRLLERLKWRRRLTGAASLQSVVDLSTGERILVRSTGGEDVIYITGSAAASFGLYYRSYDGDIYVTVGAFDAAGDIKWKYEFGPHASSETINRALVGCSSDASRVLVVETDDSTYISVISIRQSGVESTATYNLAPGERFVLSSYYRTSTSSADASRAMIGGICTVDGSENITHVGALFYAMGASTELQSVSIAVLVSSGYSPSLGFDHAIGGSADLSIAYLWPFGDVGSSYAYKKISVSETETPTVSVSDESVLPTGGAHEYAWSMPDFGHDGSFALGYVYIGTPDGASLCDTTTRVITSAGVDVAVKFETDSVADGLYANAINSVRTFSVGSGASVFAYAAKDIKINVPSDSVRVTYYGVVNGSATTAYAKGDVVKAVSNDASYVLLFQYTDLSLSAIDVEVRGPASTVSLTGVARYDTPYPYTFGRNYYQITPEAVVRDPRGFLMQPNAGAFGVGPQPFSITSQWSPLFDEETGQLASYEAMETIVSGVPPSIVRLLPPLVEGDPDIELSLTRVLPHFNKYAASYSTS